MALITTDARLLGAAALTLTCGGLSLPGATNPAGGTNLPGATNPPGATSPAGGSAAGHACDLVTDAELEQVTDRVVAEKGPTGLRPVLDTQCDYELVSDVSRASMTLGIKSPGGRAFFETSVEPTIGTGLLREAIPGLGDKAARGSGMVMVVKGDALIEVQLQQ